MLSRKSSSSKRNIWLFRWERAKRLDLNYEKYKDNLAVKNRKLDNAASMIKAARDVGVAYGKNQPKIVTYTRIIK